MVAPAKRRAPGPARPAPLRVLIVEDSHDDALLLARELEKGGYEPDWDRVETPQAMREALTSTWDVIICDYEMPRFGAPPALAAARAAGSEAPFVVVSGKVGEETAVEMMRAGAHDYVMKDNLARLCATVERGLEEARERRERRRTEEELRHSEERYRAVIEQATDGIYLLDSRTRRIIETNPSFQKMLGYTEGEMRGMPVYEFVAHPRENVDAVIRRTLEEKRRFVGERKYGRKDGSLLDVEVGVSVISYGGREVICTIVRDVTGRKRSERRLRASESELRAVLGAMNDVILVLDREGRYLKVAPTNPSLLFRPPEELLGKSLHDTFPKERADMFLDSIRRALETRERVDIEYSLRIGDQQRWFTTAVSPMLEDSVVAVARDITGRKQAEEALKQNERLYRAVIEQATEPIFLVDVATRRIVEANPAFNRTFGYAGEELEGMTLYDLVAADRDSVDANVRTVMARENPFAGVRKRVRQYRREDGSLLDVEVSASTILRGGRETLCVVVHDVTERVRAQALLEERVATLSRIASGLTLDAPEERAPSLLFNSAVNTSRAVACTVVLSDDEAGALRPVGSYGLPDGYTAGLAAAYRAGVPTPTMEAFGNQRSVLIRDVREFILAEPLYAPIHEYVREAAWDTIYVVPLVSRGRALGTINFCYLPEQEPDEDEKVFLKAVADQTAVAIENARLFSEARGKAALEERQRLARELHDSVSQALYGITLDAKTARALLKKNPDGAAESLDYVLSLAGAGMAEMRALIFELRPESLEAEGLVAALEKQAAALTARHGIEVRSALRGEPDAPPEAKETLYRVAQEALHNTVKHARASSVEIEMEQVGGWISLEISDDGAGFDAGGDFPGHLGLRSMRERASRLGGTLEIESAPHEGTRICIRIPV